VEIDPVPLLQNFGVWCSLRRYLTTISLVIGAAFIGMSSIACSDSDVSQDEVDQLYSEMVTAHQRIDQLEEESRQLSELIGTPRQPQSTAPVLPRTVYEELAGLNKAVQILETNQLIENAVYNEVFREREPLFGLWAAETLWTPATTM
jgi:hypothetical protein